MLSPTCPNCRASFPDQRMQPWFLEACQEQEVSPEGCSVEHCSTSAVAISDYTLRTFSARDVPPPPEPACVRPLCCRRLGPAPDFPELSCRRMVWAPVAQRAAGTIGSNHITSWTEEWQCQRCSSTVGLAVAAPPGNQEICNRCCRPQTWEFDAVSAAGRWLCYPSCAASSAPLSGPAAEPVQGQGPAAPPSACVGQAGWSHL